jgi:hypothetical protein
MQRHPDRQQGPVDARKFVQGLLIGLATAIPLWAALGIAGILFFQEVPIRGYQSAALMIAAIVEVFLLRYVWRTLRPALWLRQAAAATATAARALTLPRPALKRTMLLAGLVGAYLHYYYWDVHLQIASLRSVTVFVPSYGLG